MTRRSTYVIGGIFLVIFAAGVVGWRQTEPSFSWLDAIYSSLRLFVVDYASDRSPTWLLQIARFAALGAASWAVWTVVIRIVRGEHALGRAIRFRDHVVVVGAGPEVARLSSGFVARGSRVIAIGELPDEQMRILHQTGVLHLGSVSDAELARVLRGVARVVVAERDDSAAAASAGRVRAALHRETVPMTVLFTDPDLSSHWARAGAEAAVCRPTQVAVALLHETPPYPPAATTPPPIVVGDGPMAGEIARVIAVGWQEPGERRLVDCIGADRSWVEAAEIGGGGLATFRWRQVCLRAGRVPTVVRDIMGQWPLPQKPERHTILGPRVYVALSDPTCAVPIASAVAEALPTAQVVALASDTSAWINHPLPANLRLVSELDALSDPVQLCAEPHDLIRAELVAEAGRWPGDEPTALGNPRVESALVEQRTTAIAVQTVGILGEVGIECRRGLVVDAAAVVLGPDELVHVATRLGEILGDRAAMVLVHGRRPDERRLRLLELAARLPVIVARTGLTPVRVRGDEVFDEEKIAALARWAHKGYNTVAEFTGNATGSENAGKEWDALSEVDRMSNVAQTLDIPVKLAVLGLTWQAADDPELYEFSEGQTELLAELEHRRWAHFAIRNGRPGHQWNKPWDELGDQKEYDRAAVRDIPNRLAYLGRQIVPMDA